MRQAPDAVAFPWRSPDGRWFHGLGKFEALEFVPWQLQYFFIRTPAVMFLAISANRTRGGAV